MSESQFRGAVIAGAAILVVGIASLRFCGSVSIPAKPTAAAPTGTSTELLTKSAATTNVYLELLAKEAAKAGTRPPNLDDMTHAFHYTSDAQRDVLEVGQAATAVGPLVLRALQSGDSLVLEIKNATKEALAYHVVAETIPATTCDRSRPLPIDAAVIAPEQTIVRTQCVWRPGASVVVTKVETMAVDPLSAYLLEKLPPTALGIEPLIARGHQYPRDRCATTLSHNVVSEMEKGTIGWRDLADFYARHPCQTYQFPADYRALTADKQRAIPATSTP